MHGRKPKHPTMPMAQGRTNVTFVAQACQEHWRAAGRDVSATQSDRPCANEHQLVTRKRAKKLGGQRIEPTPPPDRTSEAWTNWIITSRTSEPRI